MVAVDFIRGRTTIGEMVNLPNRYSHTLYHDSWKRQFEAQKNPEGAEAKALEADAMAAAFSGQI